MLVVALYSELVGRRLLLATADTRQLGRGATTWPLTTIPEKPDLPMFQFSSRLFIREQPPPVPDSVRVTDTQIALKCKPEKVESVSVFLELVLPQASGAKYV